MKYKIQAYLRRVSAIIMSFLMGLSIFGGNDAKPKDRPDANSITAYSTDIADYRLTIDVEDLTSGIYFLNVRNEKVKFVKN